jgi:hypothetical protein
MQARPRPRLAASNDNPLPGTGIEIDRARRARAGISGYTPCAMGDIGGWCWRWRWLALMCACSASSCAESAPPLAADSTARQLPAYEGRAAELFDDAIEPSAVGFTWESDGAPAVPNAALRERVATADVVARMRVVTITSNGEGPDLVWEVGLRSLETIAGPRRTEDVTLVVNPADRASGVLRATGSRLTGKTFIAFIREFTPSAASAETAGQLHFHVAPDSKGELDAVRSAALLGQVR